ncbi:hypothetical protein ADL26_19195, partial [Thermoactinomyces vulgaris]
MCGGVGGLGLRAEPVVGGDPLVVEPHRGAAPRAGGVPADAALIGEDGAAGADDGPGVAAVGVAGLDLYSGGRPDGAVRFGDGLVVSLDPLHGEVVGVGAGGAADEVECGPA